MAFYIKPPDGTTAIAKLGVYARRRIDFLGQVLSCDDAADFRRLLEKGSSAIDSDCLIEGSKKDRISHFLLRLICSQDAEMSSFLFQAETELFSHRFSCMNSEELVHLLRSTYHFLSRLHRHRKNITSSSNVRSGAKPLANGLTFVSRMRKAYTDAVSDLHNVLKMILQSAGSWNRAVQLYMDYSSEVVGIPFQHALCLVSSRQVTLEGGVAYVPYSKLHVVLASLFETILRKGISIAHHVFPQQLIEDERVKTLSRDIRKLFYRAQRRFVRRSPRTDGKVIQESEIDQLHRFFPPCMSHLHRSLRRKHRLRHFSRVQYTLFLKEIGLPVEDAITFWRREYSRHPSHRHGDSGNGGCQHTWARDGRRYTYSIRHLYGLEGSRTNYSGHRCRALQDFQPSYGEDGGCPFKHSDDGCLKKTMDIEDITPSCQNQILKERSMGKYQNACNMYLQARMSHLSYPTENHVQPQTHIPVELFKDDQSCRELDQKSSIKRSGSESDMRACKVPHLDLGKQEEPVTLVVKSCEEMSGRYGLATRMQTNPSVASCVSKEGVLPIAGFGQSTSSRVGNTSVGVKNNTLQLCNISYQESDHQISKDDWLDLRTRKDSDDTNCKRKDPVFNKSKVEERGDILVETSTCLNVALPAHGAEGSSPYECCQDSCTSSNCSHVEQRPHRHKLANEAACRTIESSAPTCDQTMCNSKGLATHGTKNSCHSSDNSCSEDCPHSHELASDITSATENGVSSSADFEEISILKPADFYYSFRKMVTGLKHIDNG